MRNILLIIGALLIGAGVLIASGNLKYNDTDKVADFGKLELKATHEETTPVNWGWVLIGGGAVVLVGVAVARKL